MSVKYHFIERTAIAVLPFLRPLKAAVPWEVTYGWAQGITLRAGIERHPVRQLEIKIDQCAVWFFGHDSLLVECYGVN
jgi:hypothetical protein